MFDVTTFTLNDLFTYGADVPPNLTVSDEAATILAAQAGDETAKLTLMAVYAPAIRDAVARHGKFLNLEDAQGVALVAVCEAIDAWDPDRGVARLGNLLAATLDEALWDARADSQPVPVHYRALKRYYKLVITHGGDYFAAAAAAPEISMSTEVFWAVHSAVMAQADLTEDLSGSHDPFVSVDDHMAAQRALAAVEGRESDVVRYAYAFETGAPMSDAEVVEAISERDLPADEFDRGDRVMSRPTVYRSRMSALATMRVAIGVH